jgi:hypothetical protein
MKRFGSVLFAAILTLGSVAYAQDQGQTPPSQQKRESGDASKTSITGCLTKGANDGSYLITDQNSGEKLPFKGPAQLDNYVNHTVKLTGTVMGQGVEKAFSPEAIAQVALSCNKAP